MRGSDRGLILEAQKPRKGLFKTMALAGYRIEG